jgi:hypothetical protein
MKNLTFSEEQIKNIYKISYSLSELRSRKRQDVINNIVIESIISNDNYKNCEFKTEVRISGKDLLWGSYFPVDICVYRNGKLSEIIFNKAPTSNLKQNKVHMLNDINSEIMRLSKLSDIKISLINFYPNITPFFSKHETIRKFETNRPFFISTCGVPYKFDIDEVYVTFDIDKISECTTREDVRVLFEQNPIKNIKIIEENYKLKTN